MVSFLAAMAKKRILALLLSITLFFSGLFAHHAVSFAQTNAATPNSDDQHIIKVMRDYFLEHPEFMLEIQTAFTKKQQAESEKFYATMIPQLSDKLYHDSTDIVLGNPKGKKAIVEFFDYNCGYCKKNFLIIHELLKEDPELRLILKDLPILSDESMKTHIVALAFYQLKPQKFDKFFMEMMKLPGRATQEGAIKLAVSLGLNKKDLQKKMQDPTIMNKFVENNKLAHSLHINGTPAYIIKNKLIPGAVQKDVLKEALL